MKCAAVQCDSDSEKGIQLFRFPWDPERRKKWQINCQREKWQPTDCSRLCEKHFEESQFENCRIDQRRKLRKSAVPTLFNISKIDSTDTISRRGPRKKSADNEKKILKAQIRKKCFPKVILKSNSDEMKDERGHAHPKEESSQTSGRVVKRMSTKDQPKSRMLMKKKGKIEEVMQSDEEIKKPVKKKMKMNQKIIISEASLSGNDENKTSQLMIDDELNKEQVKVPRRSKSKSNDKKKPLPDGTRKKRHVKILKRSSDEESYDEMSEMDDQVKEEGLNNDSTMSLECEDNQNKMKYSMMSSGDVIAINAHRMRYRYIFRVGQCNPEDDDDLPFRRSKLDFIVKTLRMQNEKISSIHAKYKELAKENASMRNELELEPDRDVPVIEEDSLMLDEPKEQVYLIIGKDATSASSSYSFSVSRSHPNAEH